MNAPQCICLMGASLDTGNRGVSALAVSLVKIFDQLFPDARIDMFVGSRQGGARSVFLAQRQREITICNYRLSPRAVFSNHLFWLLLLALLYRGLPFRPVRRLLCRNRCLARLQAVDMFFDIWGGDSFSDIYGRKRFVFGAVVRLVVLCLGKPLVLLPQTYGPYRTGLARAVARRIIQRARLCMSRDSQGREVIGQLLGEKAAAAVQVCPDVAFVLDPKAPAAVRCSPELSLPCTESVIGVNISGLLFHGGYTRDNMFALSLDYARLAVDMVRHVARMPGVRVLLIPHTIGPAGNVNNDRDASMAVVQLLGADDAARVHVLAEDHNQSGLKAVIGMCDAFIGSRMHACIAALSQGVPTLGIAYSKKFAGVFASVGAGDMVIDARTADRTQVLAAVSTLVARAGETCEAGLLAREQVMRIFSDLSPCFAGGSPQ